MRFLFDFLFILYALLYLPFLLLRRKWHSGFGERFGGIPSEAKTRLAATRNIWVHAVSVGEVMAVEGIMARLVSAYPDCRIVLTVTTKTGHSLAQRKFQGQVEVLWSPVDISWVVHTFVRAIRPVVYVAAETELWPNLFSCLAKHEVPIFVVNGRISDEAFPRYRWVKGLLRPTLEKVALFSMQSELDAARIRELGAPSGRVVCSGNVKFDLIPEVKSPSLEGSAFSPRHQVWVAGSTHPGEEELVLAIYTALRGVFIDLRLVIAPRHPERARAVSMLVEKEGFTPVLFSTHTGAVLASTDVLVVDTIGHLMDMYAQAAIVFVGKSLTVGGGHNIIEPAAFAKPVIVGPLMQNFKDITAAFLAAGAVIQVKDALELKKEVAGLLASEERRVSLGARAREVVRSNRGATVRIVDGITRVAGAGTKG